MVSIRNFISYFTILRPGGQRPGLAARAGKGAAHRPARRAARGARRKAARAKAGAGHGAVPLCPGARRAERPKRRPPEGVSRAARSGNHAPETARGAPGTAGQGRGAPPQGRGGTGTPFGFCRAVWGRRKANGFYLVTTAQ